MFFRRLQANIAVILVIILVTGMILIDFVMMISVKGILVRSEMAKVRLFLSAAENVLNRSELDQANAFDGLGQDRFEQMFADAGIDCALSLDRSGGWDNALGRCDPYKKQLNRLIHQTMVRGEERSEFFGETSSLLLWRHEGVMIASPIFQEDRVVAGIGAALRFDAIYATLWQTQYLLILYIIINTVFLTIFGFYRLSRVTVKPVHKLLEQADDYWELDEDMFLYAQDKDGFRKLATTFNRMLKRISADKSKLEKTVARLENANQELKKAQEKVIRAEKLASVGRLSAGIAHEIGNPIAIVMGYLDLLKSDDIMVHERKDFVERTEKEIDRIHGIIRQLLNFSRSAGDNIKNVSVHDVLCDVVDVVRHQPMMSNIRFLLTLDAKQDAVKADAGKLRQVFLNLVINAGDAIRSQSSGGGQIAISSKETNNSETGRPWIQLMFQDNGPGIPQADLANIFDPFYTTKEPGKGTGLGLSTSIAIIEQMGGRISVESLEGKGTTMIVSMPLEIEAAPKNSTSTSDCQEA